FQVGQTGGAEFVALTPEHLPPHSHPLRATDSEFDFSPIDALTAEASSSQVGVMVYGGGAPPTTLHPATIDKAGANQAHWNMQPSLCVTFIICLYGVVPQPD